MMDNIRKKGDPVEFAEPTAEDRARLREGVYAYMGEEVVCERGHVVGTIRHELRLGDIFSGDEITGLSVQHGDLLPPCHCGAHFSSGDRLGRGFLRFRGGFRQW